MRRFLLAFLALAGLACSPTYDSGKTKCSTKGQCPSGYACASGVCVKGGSGGGGTVDCAASSGDSACTVCGKANCCSELNGCVNNSQCVEFVNCLGECTTSSCESSCESSHASGVAPAMSLAICLQSQCPECGSTGGSGGSTGAGGSGGSSGGTGGVSGGSSGPVKIKFCQGLKQSGSSVTLTLDVNGQKLTTSSGNCAPVNGCLTVNAGPDTPISLTQGTSTLTSGTMDFEAGMEALVRPELDADSDIVLESSHSVGICSGGTGTSGTLAKFCNLLSKNSADVTLTLKLGDVSISAVSGTCAPIGTCSSISAGTDLSISLMDGSTTVISGTYPSVVSGANMLFRAEQDDDGSPTVFGYTYSTGLCSPVSAANQIELPPEWTPASLDDPEHDRRAMVSDGSASIPEGTVYRTARASKRK